MKKTAILSSIAAILGIALTLGCGKEIKEKKCIDTEAPTGLAATPVGGSYCDMATVSLSASDGTINYTLDGNEPTIESLVYTETIDISEDTTLNFMAVDDCGNQAATVTEVYDIDTEAVVSITEPVDGVTVYAGYVTVSGTVDTDIAMVTVISDQGHSESSAANAEGNWSVFLMGVIPPSINIYVSGTDDCDNVGGDLVTVSVCEPSIWYVDTTATGDNTGRSWDNAFTVVQDAVNAASSGGMIWVAEGTYTNSPTSTASILTMKAGVEIYGGFTGTENYLFERSNPTDHPTVLDGEYTSYHVIIGASDAYLDGFTVKGGMADGIDPDNRGGGMYNSSVTDLIVANCMFVSNSTIEEGGGMYNIDSSPTITNCIFRGNYAQYYGGGMCNRSGANLTITDCTFSENIAPGGGGIFNDSVIDLVVNDCTFSENIASVGGGMFNDSVINLMVVNRISSWNSAGGGGRDVQLLLLLARDNQLHLQW
jgi:hypothetical protein